MRVYTKIVFDIETMQVLEAESFEYSGPVAYCKDHGQDTANAQRQQQLDLQKSAYNLQKQQFAQISGALGKYLTGNIGFDPSQLAAMKSQFLNNAAGQFQNAGQATRQALAARGGGLGDTPIGGDYTRGIASLMGAAASNQSQGLLGLDIANQQQALTNKFNTGSLLSGNAASLNSPINSFGSGASSALNAYINAKSIPGFGEQFSGALAKGLGAGIGGGLTGGLGTYMTNVANDINGNH